MKPSQHKRKVIQCEYTGKPIKEFESIASASRETGINKRNIYKCCKKITNSSGGFYWKYAPTLS